MNNEINDLTLVATSVPYCEMKQGQYWNTMSEYVKIGNCNKTHLIARDFKELWIVHWFKRDDGLKLRLFAEPPISGDDFDCVEIKPYCVWAIGRRGYIHDRFSTDRTLTHRQVPLESSREFLSIEIRPKSN